MPDLRCTYRVQLTPELGFRRVREVVLPYLRDLGVSHLYLSPVLKAQAGSTHGYDVVDPTRVSAGLGGEDELRALCEAADAAGLGTILDVVPNHMAASEEENRLWRDPGLRARAGPRPRPWRKPRGRPGGGRPASGATRSCARGSSTGIPRAAGTAASSTSANSTACGSRTRRSSRRHTKRCCSSCARGSS